MMKTNDIKKVTTLGAMAGLNSGLEFAREIEAEMVRMGYLPGREAPAAKTGIVEPRETENSLTYGNTKPS